MKRRRVKYGTLKRTDHRLDMSPAGRNLFVSRDKQAQNRQARKLRLWMRVVLGLVIAAVAGVLCLTVFSYLGPWFRQELSLNSGSPSSSEASGELSQLPEYDGMGLEVYGEDVCLFVVNSASPADPDFAPELAEAGNVQVDARIAPALRLMISAAKEDGLALVLTQGYLSYDQQKKRFEDKVAELEKEKGLTAVMARTEAASLEPQPGESDFQSGMCVRISGDPKTFEDSRTYSWLKANMGKYGFVFRYPEYKEDYTGIEADPTVIRYVGSACAAAMQQRSMCLEEYIDYLDRQ